MIAGGKMPVDVIDGRPIIGRGIGFERVRRITGYLVGDLDRFNNAKRAEEAQRVKHCGSHNALKGRRAS